jgi:hypothetical protein
VFRGPERRLIVACILLVGLVVACTSSPPPPVTESGAAKPAGSPSPAPVAQATPTAIPARPAVGGGAAQPRANPTFTAPGGNAIIIVPTPNFAVNATSVPAALAPAATITNLQPANIPQVTGTLSRIPTAIPSGGGGGGGGAGGGGAATGAAAAAAATGGGGGTGIQTIPVVITATPLTRINPQPQPTIAYPPR